MSRLVALPERFLSRPERSLGVGISLLGVVALMALVVPTEPLVIDQRWSEAMHDLRTPLLTDLALVFNALGHGLGWALSLAAVGVVLSRGGGSRSRSPRRRRWRR